MAIKLTIAKDKPSASYGSNEKEEVIFCHEVPESVLLKLIGEITTTIDNAKKVTE